MCCWVRRANKSKIFLNWVVAIILINWEMEIMVKNQKNQVKHIHNQETQRKGARPLPFVTKY